MKAADGLTDPIQKAVAVLQATEDSVKDTVATFTKNNALSDHIAAF